jgi:hypothetical protein
MVEYYGKWREAYCRSAEAAAKFEFQHRGVARLVARRVLVGQVGTWWWWRMVVREGVAARERMEVGIHCVVCKKYM